MNEVLITGGVPVTLYSNMLFFKDSIKSFKLVGDHFKTMTNYDFNNGHSNPQDQKIVCRFGKEMNFNIRQKGQKTTRDTSHLSYLNHLLT